MLADFISQISFLELGLTLITLGVIERCLHCLPSDIVGPGGWLLDTGEAE